jgi:aromatic ring-cleaving dioxygenase
MKIAFAILFALLVFQTLTHSTRYPGIDRNEACYKPEPAKIYSWHFHVIYWQHVNEHKKGAYELRDKFATVFASKLTKPCIDLFHQDYLCMFEPDYQPVGPFVTAQWSVFFLPEDFNTVVPWIMQHRGKYDVLVHPNSGCEIEDHSWWAFWGGNPWPINLDAFSHDDPFPWKENIVKKTSEELLESEEASELVKEFIKEHESHH